MSNQQRMDAIASNFGDKDKINIFLGREKIYPNKEVSDATLEWLENTLKSPESEKATLRVLEKQELIYRSSQGALDFDSKNIAPQLQANSLSQTPETPQVKQSQTVAQNSEKEQVIVGQNKEVISFPINATQPEINQKMQEIVKPAQATNEESLKEALAAANARIDALQSQLQETKQSLQDLSKFVRNDNLKSWAEQKAQQVGKISQSIAEQAKNNVKQWLQAKTAQVKEAVHEKVDEAKGAVQGKINEAKTLAQNKSTEIKTAAQLKAIEFKESVREQTNKFLAPVNSEKVERAAKYIVQAYGDGKSYDKAATHSFKLNENKELSISRQSDGAVIYEKGELTKAANSHDILKLNALPTVVDQIKAKQMQSSGKQQMEVGG